MTSVARIPTGSSPGRRASDRSGTVAPYRISAFARSRLAHESELDPVVTERTLPHTTLDGVRVPEGMLFPRQSGHRRSSRARCVSLHSTLP